MAMTEQEAQETLRGSVVFVAYLLDLPELGPTPDLINQITQKDPAIGSLLIDAYTAYEEWWSVSKRPELSEAEREQLRQLIIKRNDTRQALANAFSNRTPA
ncbi:hypothetical protein GCM10027347_59420 [Larkinella harenae]